jgi:hypothetical protein
MNDPTEKPADPITAPKKHGSEKRERQSLIQLRVTAAEQAEIAAKAERAGLSVAGYLRALALGTDTPQPRAARRPPVEKEELVRLQHELRKIGGNINQIAHHLNRSGENPPPIIATVLAEHIAAARAIVAALGQKVGE